MRSDPKGARAACREPPGREFIEPVGRTKGSLKVERQNGPLAGACLCGARRQARAGPKATDVSPWCGVNRFDL